MFTPSTRYSFSRLSILGAVVAVGLIQCVLSAPSSTPPPGPPDCNLRESLVEINQPGNTSDLISSIQTAYNSWNASTKLGFNSYFNQIKNVSFSNDSLVDIIDKLIVIMSQYNANNVAKQQVLWNVTISGWGTIQEFINCGNATEIEPTTVLPSTASHSTASPSTHAAPSQGSTQQSGQSTVAVSGSPPPADCAERPELIAIDASNATILTDSIQAAYSTWNASMKMGFNTYYNKIRNVLWDNSTSEEYKIEELIVIFEQYNANNKNMQMILWSVMIEGWGTIQQFIMCGNATGCDDCESPATGAPGSAATGGPGSPGTVSAGTGQPGTPPSGATSNPSVATMVPDLCSERPELIAVDASNATILTDSIQAAYSTWNISMKMGFNTYYNKIRAVLWNNSTTAAEKINALIVIFEQYNANNKNMQMILWDVEIEGWGTIEEFINCGNATDCPGCGSPATGVPGSPPTGQPGSPGTPPNSDETGEPSGATLNPDMCAERPDLISIYPSTNTTTLTDSIQEAYDSWNASTKLGFNSYYNQIKAVLYNNSTSEQYKIDELIVIFKEYNANNAQKQQVLWNVTITGWGTIEDFILCGNATDCPDCTPGSPATGGLTIIVETETPFTPPSGQTFQPSVVTFEPSVETLETVSPVSVSEEPVTEPSTEEPVSSPSTDLDLPTEPSTVEETTMESTLLPLTTPACPAPPPATSSLIFDNADSQIAKTTTPVATCTTCSVPGFTQAVKNYYTTVPDANNANDIDDAEAICSNINNFCMCTESGECFHQMGNTLSQVNFYVYCDPASPTVCHTYAFVIDAFDGTSGLTGNKGTNFVSTTQLDGSGNPVPMGSSSVYLKAVSVSCSGCAPIQGVICA